jgi:hypothetical protein
MVLVEIGCWAWLELRIPNMSSELEIGSHYPLGFSWDEFLVSCNAILAFWIQWQTKHVFELCSGIEWTQFMDVCNIHSWHMHTWQAKECGKVVSRNWKDVFEFLCCLRICNDISDWLWSWLIFFPNFVVCHVAVPVVESAQVCSPWVYASTIGVT